MPELPDLEAYSYYLNKEIRGKKLLHIRFRNSAKVNVSEQELRNTLEKQRLLRAWRDGKELRFSFKNGSMLGIHLMLRGTLVWLDEDPRAKNVLLEMGFENGKTLALTDFQKQARITLNPIESEVPDALAKKANPPFWRKQLDSTATIKSLLMDQHVVRGIGNAYADEILWTAGISPFSIANKIPRRKIAVLSGAIRQVLTTAERHIRKSAPGIIGGEIRDFLKIHNSHKKKSPDGGTIRKKMTAGRPTYYTSEQKLYS
jgi:formamidopyrimidine-DNA glycosylase